MHFRGARRVASVASMAFLSTSCTSSVATPPITRMLPVYGYSVRVVSAGLESRRPNAPVVVFESGGATPLETWDPVLFQVAGFSPVLAYDRSGTGESAWDGEPPTPERIVARLHQLLDQLRAGPPYILVGHSWGGALVRYFAGAYPDDVAGILYLDPTDITISPAEELELYNSIGSGPNGRDAFYALMEGATSGLPPQIRAESEVLLGLLRAEPSARGLRTVPPVPASVVLAGKQMALPGNLLPFDTEAYARAAQEQRARRLQEWVKEGGRFVVAEDAGHFVHVDEPQLVISLVKELINGRR